MATFDAVDRGLLGYGGTLEDASFGLFDGKDLNDCPFGVPFQSSNNSVFDACAFGL